MAQKGQKTKEGQSITSPFYRPHFMYGVSKRDRVSRPHFMLPGCLLICYVCWRGEYQL